MHARRSIVVLVALVALVGCPRGAEEHLCDVIAECECSAEMDEVIDCMLNEYECTDHFFTATACDCSME